MNPVIANTLVVVTLHDIVGLTIFGIIVLGIGIYAANAFFQDWKHSPKRWWNKKK